MTKWLITFQHRSCDRIDGKNGPEFTGVEMLVTDMHPAHWLIENKAAAHRKREIGIHRVTQIEGILSAIEMPDEETAKALNSWL